jgi:hypothetical protein
MQKIGVEDSLTNVQDALREKGYEVVQFRNEDDVKDCDCYVINGLENNVMGMQNISTKSSIIEASGLSAEEICKEVENKLQH